MKKSLSLIFAALLCVSVWAQEVTDYAGTWYIKHVQSGMFLAQKNVVETDSEVSLAKNGSQFVVSADGSGDYNLSIAGSINYIGAGDNDRVLVDQTSATSYKIEAVTGGVVISSGGNYLILQEHGNDYVYLALRNVNKTNATVFELTTESSAIYDDIRTNDDFESYDEKQVYTIASMYGNFIHTPNGISSTLVTGDEIDESDPNQQFMFLKDRETGTRYLYSVGAKDFYRLSDNHHALVPTYWDASQVLGVEILLIMSSYDIQHPVKIIVSSTGSGNNALEVTRHYEIYRNNGQPAVFPTGNSEPNGKQLIIRPVNEVTYDMTFLQASTDPRIPLRKIYETAMVYSVGDGVDQYSVIFNTLGKEVSYNEFWNAMIVEAEKIFNDSIAYTEERINNLIETFEKYIPQLRHNTIHENSFIRLKSKSAEGIYVQNVNTTDNCLDVSTEPDKNSIFLIRDGSLVSYSTGRFLDIFNNTLMVAETPETKTEVDVFAATSDKTVYLVRFKGYDNKEYYLYATNANTNAMTTSFAEQKTELHFIVEPVTELPITMNNVEGGYYGTINFPVAVELPEGLTAYSATEKPTHLTLAKVAEGGQVLAANTPVIIYSDNNVDYVTISSEAGVGATDNCLSGTVEAKTVVSGANYVLGNKEGLAFYKYTNTKMPAFKAYLAPSSALSQKFGFIFADDDLTGVANAIKEAARTNTTVFDINGRMVNELVKGQLYIQGGKKFRY